MLFNSYIFIFLFFPCTLCGWYLLNKFQKYKLAELFLIGMSLWFYGYYNVSYLAIICTSIVFNYLFSNLIRRCNPGKIKKLCTAIGIICNVAVLFYFKYYDFFVENVNSILHTEWELKHIVLPLGISFFTFQQISYLADTYMSKETKSTFIEYALFVCFFPQLIAGPIVSYEDMVPQFQNKNNRKFDVHNFSRGIYIFAIGLFKKVMIADLLGQVVNIGYGDIATITSLECWIVSLSYTLQLFFDFSGYCDMAIGLGYMMNIVIPQNFNSPYKATSIPDFWKRWHMSLTRFLTTYIYIPLGGNRKGKVRTYLNIMIVFLISGIWHGANWTFVLWGLLHGVFNCIGKATEKAWNKLGEVTRWFITFNIVNTLWIVFRAETVNDAISFIKRMISMESWGIRDAIYNVFLTPALRFFNGEVGILTRISSNIVGVYMWVFLFVALMLVLNCKNSKEIEFKPTLWRGVLTVICLVCSIVSLSGMSTFLYFDF